MCQTLIALGANVEARDVEVQSSLMLACARGHVSAVQVNLRFKYSYGDIFRHKIFLWSFLVPKNF